MFAFSRQRASAWETRPIVSGLAEFRDGFAPLFRSQKPWKHARPPNAARPDSAFQKRPGTSGQMCVPDFRGPHG